MEIFYYAVDIEIIQSPVKNGRFCTIKNLTKLNQVRPFSNLNVKLQRIKIQKHSNILGKKL